MRVSSVIQLSAAIGAMVLLPAGRLFGPTPLTAVQSGTPVQSTSCQSRISVACADSRMPEGSGMRALPAGDAPAFLFAAVQPIEAPKAWRIVYHEVERCAGMVGDYDQIRWSVMEGPLRGPKGPTYGFNVGSRIVLVRQDTTYLRHEMLHHILQVAGWQPRPLQLGEHYSIPDLHPMLIFRRCAGGGEAAA